MNKKLIHLLTTKLPILSVIILILAYVYLSIPETYLLQLGGVDNVKKFSLPKNVPFVYKFRWMLVIIPILILGHLIYSVYFTQVLIPSTTVWDIGKDFFYQFQIELNKHIALNQVELTPSGSGAITQFSYKNIPDSITYGGPQGDSAPDKNLWKFYNIIQITGDPRSIGYTTAQYFCNSIRPCSCCNEPGYIQYFTTPSFDMKESCAKQMIKPPSVSPSKAQK